MPRLMRLPTTKGIRMTSMTEEQITAWIAQASQEGREAGERAASWVIDGNTSHEAIVALVKLMDDGAPDTDDYLPTCPNLSGEWADAPTVIELYREITGREPEDSLGFETEHGWLIDKLANAWEEGVAETFEVECERIVRAAL